MLYTDILGVFNEFFFCVVSLFNIYQNKYEILYLTFNGISEQRQKTTILRIREKFVTNKYICFSLLNYADILEKINNYVVTYKIIK